MTKEEEAFIEQIMNVLKKYSIDIEKVKDIYIFTNKDASIALTYQEIIEHLYNHGG